MKNEQLPPDVIDQARATDLVLLAESYGVKMAKQGKDFFGLCPFHSENSPSFTIYSKNSGPHRFHCMGCGADGDAIQFVQDYEGLKFRDAVRRLVGTLPATGNAPTPAAAHVPAEPEEVWTPVLPVPDSAPMTPDTIRRKIKGQWVSVKASRRWDYRDASGDVLGYVFRFDMPGGGKEVLPLVWAVSSLTGEMQWRWISFPKPRPLYGLDKLAENQNAQVLVVEGEKAADAAQELFVGLGVPMSKLVVVSWPGGGKAIKHVDFGALGGRSVALWPDADQKPYPANHERAGVTMPFLEQPGTTAMLDVWQAIRDTATSVKFVMPPEGVPDGWDLADPPPSGFSLLAHIKSSTVDPATLVQANEPAEPVRPIDPVKPEAPAPRPDVIGDDYDDGEDVQSEGYFSILGYNRETYYVFQQEARQIFEYTKGDFTDTGFIALAPLHWWETNFPSEQSGFSKKLAANWFVRRARAKGIYDPSRTRGRGAWIDQGRVVLHLGNTLYVDGVKTDVTKIASRYVYELDRALPDLSPVALTVEEGRWLLDVAKMFRWNRAASAPLLAGWVALAPLCGAMKWRPHIWITGGAGSGKTSILNEYVHALIDGIALFAQGNSTEAGIRQTLHTDARPVLFDESESNEEKDRLRIQGVLSMIRQASSESAALTLKGTSHGASLNFHVRSMFALASIQVALKHQADMERLAVLALRQKRAGEDSAADQWRAVQSEFAKIRNDETLPGRLFRRSVDLLPVTMQNIAVFTRSAAEKFGSQRDGDQYGTLMAGAWSLQSDALATPKQAREMLDAYNWDDHMEHAETDESQMALGALMGAMVSLQGGAKCTIHELVMMACGRPVPGAPELTPTEAGAALKRLGLKAEGGSLLLANRMLPPLEEIMRHSQFAADLRGQLLRLPGAARYPKVIRFGGALDRGYSIPLQPLLDETQPGAAPQPAPF